MRACTEFTGVEIPPHVFHGDIQLFDSGEELVIVSLTLATTDDFTDLGEEYVHGADSAAVFILLHVEGLYVAGIVGENHRTLEMLLHQIAFMLALEVGAPVDREFEFLSGSLENLHTFSISETYEIVVKHKFETVDKFFVEVLCKEFDIVAAVVESISDAVFHEFLCQIHILGYVAEGNFRLHHPEFAQVAGRVGILGTESRTESIDRTESGGAELTLKLTGNGKRSGLAEEILRIVDSAVLVLGKILKGQGSHLEHSACAFTVARSDEGSIEIEETFLLEKLMNRKSKSASYSQNGTESCRTGAQMCFLS